MTNRLSYAIKVGVVMVASALLAMAVRGLDEQRTVQRSSTFLVFGLPLLIGLCAQLAVAITRPSAGEAGSFAFVIAIVAAVGAWFVAVVIGLNIWGS
jgi:hypothetical protein